MMDAVDFLLPDGSTGLLVCPTIPDDASPELREGLARRRLVVTGQGCPCGAAWRPPTRQQRRAAARWGEQVPVTVWHETGCPAGDPELQDAIKAYRASRAQ